MTTEIMLLIVGVFCTLVAVCDVIALICGFNRMTEKTYGDD